MAIVDKIAEKVGESALWSASHDEWKERHAHYVRLGCFMLARDILQARLMLKRHFGIPEYYYHIRSCGLVVTKFIPVK